MRPTIGIFIMVLAVTTTGPLAAGMCGDCNNDGMLTSADSLAAAQHAGGSVLLPGPLTLRCDVNSSGRVDILDALLIEQTVQGVPGTPALACLPPGDCSVGQGFDPGLSTLDFLVLEDQLLGTGLFGPPLTDAALAACDADGNGTTDVIDLIHMRAATFGPFPPNVPRCLSCGDCNEDGTLDVINDANSIFAALIGILPLDARSFDACDVDNDAAITPVDVLSLSVGIRACDLGAGTASIFGSGTYTIAPGSTGSGVPWTFLVGGTGSLSVVPGTAVAPVGADPTALAMIWRDALLAVPGFIATSAGSTFTVTDATGAPAVVAITGPLPYCLAGLGNACRFNGEMVERHPDGEDPPVAVADEVTTSGSTPSTFEPLPNDWVPDDEIDPSSLQVIGQPTYGQATANDDGTITVVMEPDYEGKDAGAYEVCGFNGVCNRALFKIAAESGNQPPNAVDDFASVQSGGTVTIDLLANDSDPDGDPIKVTEVSEPASGVAQLGEGGLLTYFADPKFNGTVSLTYGLTDDHDNQAEGTVTLTVKSGKR